MDETELMPESGDAEPYPLQFGHVEGGEYEYASDELGPGRVERAGSRGQQLEEQYEEEQAIAASPPKMLPPPFPMNPAGAPLNNPPMPGNEEAMQQHHQQQQQKAAPPVGEGQEGGAEGMEAH